MAHAAPPIGGKVDPRKKPQESTPKIPQLPSAPSIPPIRSATALGALPAPRIGMPSIPGTGGLSFGSLARDVLKRINAPFNYNPQKDPRYQALVKLAEIRGQAASRRALEELNSRGILNSTITAERLGQIQQAAEQENVLQFLPQMYEQALQLRQQQIANLMNLLGAVQNQEQFGANLRADLYKFARSYSLSMAELAQRMREFEFDAKMRRAAFELDRIATEQQLGRQTNPVVTSRVIGQVVGMSGPDAAFRWLSENAYRLAGEGADLNAVLQAIIARWPEHFHVKSDPMMMIPFGAFAGENPQ